MSPPDTASSILMSDTPNRPRTRSFDRAKEEEAAEVDVAALKKKSDKKAKKAKKEKKEKKDKKDKKDKKRKRGDDSDDADSVEVEAEVSPEEESSKKSSKKSLKKKKLNDGAATPVTTRLRRTAEERAAEDKEEETSIETFPLSDFDLSQRTLDALQKRGVKSLFEIQARTFPEITAGKDVIGRAHTGCGKTLAFALPVIEMLERNKFDMTSHGRSPAVLIMAPTRELAMQVSKEFTSTGPQLSTCTVYGGAPMYSQTQAMRQGLDCVVGTPGRICDHIERGSLKLGRVSFLILDEADQMLDMGFEEQMKTVFDQIEGQRRAAGTEAPLQTLLFSATLPKWVRDVARTKMKSPITVDLVGDEEKQASSDVEHLCLQCPWHARAKIVTDLIKTYGNVENNGSIIAFCQTKKACNELAVDPALAQDAKVLHGDIAQGQRETTLAGFRNNRFPLLVATDVAARGLDISGVDLVIQVEPPAGAFSGKAEVQTYVHRSGRTGRAGRKGYCITLFKPQQAELIKQIERGTGNTLRRIGAPQPVDILKAQGRQTAERIANLDPEVTSNFREVAQMLIDEIGPQEAICGALAELTGFKTAAMLQPRSLLQSAEGFITVQYSSGGKELHGLGWVWNALRRVLPPNAVESVKGMQLTADLQGAVFDFDAKHKAALEQVIAQGGSDLEIISELPKLQERPSFNRGGGGGGGYGGRNGGRGGFGGRNGGFGGRRGGGGGRSFGGRGRGRGRW